LSSRPDAGAAGGVDFFRRGALPVPPLTTADAERVAASSFGLRVRAQPLGSRFNYASVVEFTERLAGLLPAPLDTVFGVNSGSEAVDLALRLALAATGHRDVVTVREAYHGWTYASDAVSTSTADNPNALATRPGWVHAVDAPNTYRGRYRGTEAGSGASSSRAWCRTWSRWPRPWATATRSARSSPPARSPSGTATRGTSSPPPAPARSPAWSELGVIIQPTGDRMCVLKIKPPLCLDTEAADFFADALDRVLTEGW
jgi:4-aminobutyrate aminotransferase-like enzyme